MKGMYKACRKGRKDIILSLLGDSKYIGADIFEIACKSGNQGIVRWMVQELDTKHWASGMKGAIFGGHLHIVKLLLNLGNFDIRKRTFYAELASANKQKDIVEFFLIDCKQQYQAGYIFIMSCIYRWINLIIHCIITIKNIEKYSDRSFCYDFYELFTPKSNTIVDINVKLFDKNIF